MADGTPVVEITEAEFERHLLQIERRELAECEERARNRRAGHPRDLAEYVGEGDECVSPPIVERPAKVSVALTMNRGLGEPVSEGD
jgi:hypothetical protein